jgi:hypothetical protein
VSWRKRPGGKSAIEEYGNKKKGEEVTKTTHVHLFVLVSSRAATFCVIDNNAASPDFLSIFSYQRLIEDQSYANVQTKTYLAESAFPTVYSVQKFLERILHIGHFSRILSSATRGPYPAQLPLEIALSILHFEEDTRGRLVILEVVVFNFREGILYKCK